MKVQHLPPVGRRNPPWKQQNSAIAPAVSRVISMCEQAVSPSSTPAASSLPENQRPARRASQKKTSAHRLHSKPSERVSPPPMMYKK